jgi:hypothetical protein
VTRVQELEAEIAGITFESKSLAIRWLPVIASSRISI